MAHELPYEFVTCKLFGERRDMCPTVMLTLIMLCVCRVMGYLVCLALVLLRSNLHLDVEARAATATACSVRIVNNFELRPNELHRKIDFAALQ
jgi:hypothetical protein